MYAPAPDDEMTGLVNYLADQLTAIRSAAIGLTEEQARLRPCRSALSIGGLLKHVTYGMRGAVARLEHTTTPPAVDEVAYARYQASFALEDGETCAAALDAFDDARAAYLAAISTADPEAPTVEPPSPWFGVVDERPANVRYLVVHQVEEMARHAGHADILREEIDGVAVPRIVLSSEGMPASAFFEPYVPAPGTLGAG